MRCYCCVVKICSVFSLFISSITSYAPLSDQSLLTLADPGKDFDIHTGALLAPILQPRIPGTPGSLAVLQHFVDFFRTSLPEWTIELQNSTWKTPISGDEFTPFVNFIATRDPPWSTPGEVGRLALVAHYDSLITPDGFIGAIDSAAPCAMLMHAARDIDGALTRKWASMKADGSVAANIEADKGIQIIFLDGEEAFRSWTDEDSLYGARSLAATWEQSPYTAMSTYPNPISSISLFLLLDLLGSPNPRIPSYFRTTHWAYQSMANLESRLRSLKQFKSSLKHMSKNAASSQHGKGSPEQYRQEHMFLADSAKTQFSVPFIGDDHIPFMARGVEVLHIIPTPFPLVWHTINDDGEHLDMDTVQDWAKLVTGFTAEWMELEGFLARARPAAMERELTAEDATLTRRTEL